MEISGPNDEGNFVAALPNGDPMETIVRFRTRRTWKELVVERQPEHVLGDLSGLKHRVQALSNGPAVSG
jgi:hypothetical protein